jgi:hypothetical protein
MTLSEIRVSGGVLGRERGLDTDVWWPNCSPPYYRLRKATDGHSINLALLYLFLLLYTAREFAIFKKLTSKTLQFIVSRARTREPSGSTCLLGKMAALGTGVKRKLSVSCKNNYASDTSENLSDTSDVYEVSQFIINFPCVLFFLNLCVCVCVCAVFMWFGRDVKCVGNTRGL